MLCWWRLVLLLGSLLLSAALDREEQQKETEALDYAPATADADLGPPENVTVEVVSESSLNVSWDPPAVKPRYYSVRWDAQEEGTYDTFYVVTGLKPCTTYIFTVASVYASTTFEAPNAQGETEDAVPPQPGECSFTEIYSNAIKISWDEPDTSCRIDNYIIEWWWDILWMEGQESGETFTTRPYFTLTDLPPYANLTIQVVAAAEAGRGPPRTCWDVTNPEKPGPPVIQEVTPYAGSARVTWSPPHEANGIILEYEVNFQDEEGFPVSESVAGTVLTILVEDLEPCKSYSVTALARTEAGWGPYSDALGTVILGNVPVDDVSCGTDHRRVKVCWVSPSTKCPVALCNVRWTGTVLWDNQTLSGSDPVPWEEEEMCYVLEETVPYTDYTICVTVDDYDNGSKCCSQETPQTAPGPPLLEDLQTDNRTIIVNWKDPVDKNGIIEGYNITWHGSSGVSHEDYEAAGVYSHQISDLEPCQSYSVAVTAHTGGGWGNYSDTKTAVIENYIAESSLSCSSEEPRQVELRWSLASPVCSVPQYLLLWNTSVLWSNQNSSNTSNIPGNTSSFELCKLEPYTLFVACLSVVGEESSVCCSNITQEEEPSEPTDLQVVNTTTTIATVSWSLPVQLNGVLGGWRLTWYLGNESVDEVDLDVSELQYTIVDLLPDTTYYIYLMASTGAGPGDPAEISVTTDEKVSPHNIQVGVIVGASFGGLLLVIAVLGSGVYFYRRKKTRTKHSPLVNDMQVNVTDGRSNHDTYSSELYKRQQRHYWGQRYYFQQQTYSTSATGREELQRKRHESQVYDSSRDHRGVRGAPAVAGEGGGKAKKGDLGQLSTSQTFENTSL